MIDRNFITKNSTSGLICIPFIKTSHQLADTLTDGLISTIFHHLCFKLDLRDIRTTFEGSVSNIIVS